MFESVTRKLPARLLQAMFNQTRFASNANGYGPTVGVMLRFGPDGFTAVATDSIRLAKAETACVNDDKELSVVVPAKSIDTFMSAELEPEEMVTVEATDNQIAFDSFGFRLVTTLMEGVFPNHDDMLNKEFPSKATVGRLALHHALTKASIILDKNNGAKMSFGEKEISIHSRAQDSGESIITVPCRLEGPPIEIGFNTRYLMDGLDATSSDDVVIGMSSPRSPGIMTAQGFAYLVMPMSLS
jgi:DNA polymerase-3 subunit beta